MKIDCKLALKDQSGEPVPGFGIQFRWHANYWPQLFDAQVDVIRRHIARARSDGKLIVYLSCPISARGGGSNKTNVELALSVERQLLDKWGEGVWILNPAQYQMESDHGESMMQEHADTLGIDLSALRACYSKAAPAPSGGDYMRMWTKVLVEDDPVDVNGRPYYAPPPVSDPALKNSGQHFDAFYFLGPRDMHDFFRRTGGSSLSLAIEAYFTSRFASDPDFRDTYSVDGIAWGTNFTTGPSAATQRALRQQWEELRKEYLRFYSLRASANFSLGSHDEWNIFCRINEIRRARYGAGDNRGIAEQLAGFFDGTQIDPASTETRLSKGYAL